MELTVGFLRNVIEDLDDDVILADLGLGNTSFEPLTNVKRLLYLKGIGELQGKKFLVINSMGSHFSGEYEQKDLKYTGIHFDESNL